GRRARRSPPPRRPQRRRRPPRRRSPSPATRTSRCSGRATGDGSSPSPSLSRSSSGGVGARCERLQPLRVAGTQVAGTGRTLLRGTGAARRSPRGFHEEGARDGRRQLECAAMASFIYVTALLLCSSKILL